MSDDRTTNPHKTVVTVVGQRQSAAKSGARDACLVVIYGEDLGRRVPLGSEPVVIGRSSRCELQIDQESVSRNHCRIAFDGRSFAVRDLGSTNGTYVNDEQVESAELRDGDQLKVGRTILKFIVGGNIEGQYHEEIYRLMTVDGLTQVHNKRFFDEMLDRELSRARRYGSTFGLILFDIDHFKQINDTFGHLAGDHVLETLAKLVTRTMRKEDFFARWGGEEFAILSRGIDLEGGRRFAERLRTLVEGHAFVHEGKRMPVTMSVGVAAVPEIDVREADVFVQCADEALYAAKQGGRNRVVMYGR